MRWPSVSNLAIEIELMLGKRNRKEDAVRIDVDWLLGETSQPAKRGFPWFRNFSMFLVCVLALVWCWPWASRQWLNWELQQQLTHSSSGPSEDVLPTMVAIHDLNPNSTHAMVEQLASSDANKRSYAFHLLEERILQWSHASPAPVSEIAALIDSLGSDRFQGSAILFLRAQLATQLRQLVTNEVPNASNLIASIERMLAQGESAIQKQVNAPVLAAKYQLNDSTRAADDPVEPIVVRRLAGPSQGHLTSMRKLTDQTVEMDSASSSNRELAIPRTIYKGMEIQTPERDEPMSPLPPPSTMSTAEAPVRYQEPISINGIEKLELEKLLPLLNSPQTKIERQAFNELVRREIPQSILELAIVMSQGEADEKLKAMDAIARDPKNNAIPWLGWMAESTDRNVRRRAIALLGSMTDPDAIRKLRARQSREPDNSIVDQINQVLLASGTASKSVR